MQDVVTKRTIGRVFFWPAAGITTLCAVLLYGSFHSDRQIADAQIVNFYAGGCNGGWEGSEKASGEPQVTTQSSETYSKENAAYLENKLSPITCNQYSGTLPPETYHTRVMVRFSWTQVNPPQEVVPVDISPQEESTSTASTTDTSNAGGSTTDDGSTTIASSTREETSTSTDAVSTTTEPVSDEASSSAVELPQETTASSSTEGEGDTISPSEPSAPTISPEPPEAPKATEPDTPSTETPVPQADTVSWWPHMWPAYAEAEELATSTSELVPAVDTQSTDSSLSASETGTTTLTATTSVEEGVSSTPVATTTATDGAQFGVEYTLDGESWHILGYVTTVDSDVRLEFPREVLPTLEDISRVQVRIMPLSQIGTIQPVYLDAVWLEVSYAPLGELGVHGVSDIVPTITPFPSLISDTDSTSSDEDASTTLPHLTTQAFANSITAVHGIDERYVLVTLRNGTSTEMWLFDMRDRLIHRIGRDKAQIGTMQAGTKDGMIFWLNAEHTTIYTYDLRTAGSLHEMTLVANLPVGGEYVLTFPFTAWQVIWRGNTFYFKTRKTGEVFQDENTNAAVEFFNYFKLVHLISYERIQEIGGTFVTENEIVPEIATSTTSGIQSTSTPEIRGPASTSTEQVSGTSTIEYIP